MHVLVVPSWYPTRYDTVRGHFFRQQALALRRSGLQIGVIAPAPRSLRFLGKEVRGWPSGVAVESDEGIPTYRYYSWTWTGRLRRLYYRLWMRAGRLLFTRYVADWGFPDLVHAHVVHYAGTLAAEIKERYEIPYVITEHSSAYARGLLRRWQLSLVHDALAGAEARLVVSPELGNLLQKQFASAAMPWSWVPNVVGDGFRLATSRVCKPSQESFRFLNVALMTVQKGQADLLRAFAAEFQGDPTVQLRIGGDGPMRAELQKLALDLDISRQVTFLGMLDREQVIAEMQRADAFVLASHYETFGVVLIEALACGTPIIATACGGPECIVHPSNGILVQPGDVTALGAAMAQMRETSCSYVPEVLHSECIAQFGEQAVTAQLNRIYQSCMRKQA